MIKKERAQFLDGTGTEIPLPCAHELSENPTTITLEARNLEVQNLYETNNAVAKQEKHCSSALLPIDLTNQEEKYSNTVSLSNPSVDSIPLLTNDTFDGQPCHRVHRISSMDIPMLIQIKESKQRKQKYFF